MERKNTTEGISIYVGNLPWDFTMTELHNIFDYLSPLECNLSYNMSGRSRGFAIIKFIDKTQAEEAIKNLNGMILNGRKIEVGN